MLVDNHAHLPTGGGLDYEAVTASREAGCLDFAVGGRSRDRGKPARLTLEYIKEDPAESFLLLELATLTPRLSETERLREEFLDLGDDVVDRSAWDEGHLGYDEQGREIPLPAGAILVTRWLGGKILFVTKGSRWNGTPATYDGRQSERRERDLQELFRKAKKPVALFIDDAHGLHPKTLTALKRLIARRRGWRPDDADGKLDPRGALFSSWGKARRKRSLADLLESFSPMYEVTYQIWAQQDNHGKLDPAEIEACEGAEWPDPKW